MNVSVHRINRMQTKKDAMKRIKSIIKIKVTITSCKRTARFHLYFHRPPSEIQIKLSLRYIQNSNLSKKVIGGKRQIFPLDRG